MEKKTTRHVGVDAPALPSRRNFLGGAAAVTTIGAASLAVAALPAPSPIPALFEEWKAKRGALNAIPADDEAASDAVMAEMDAIEIRIRQTPAQSYTDLAVKIALWFETGAPIGWEAVTEYTDWGEMMLHSAYRDALRLGGLA